MDIVGRNPCGGGGCDSYQQELQWYALIHHEMAKAAEYVIEEAMLQDN